MIRETMLIAMLDIFEHPQNFTMNGSISIADIISKDIGEQEGLGIIVELSKNCNINLNGTGIQSNITRMREVLEQDIGDYSKGTVQDIQSLVNQVIPEISDPTIEDETERQEQIDMERMLTEEIQEK